MRKLFYKKYFNLVLASEDSIDLSTRLENFWQAFLAFAPVAFILKAFNVWFETHELFFIGILMFILINMILGAYMHLKKGSFSFETLLIKTIKMTIILFITYLILAIILAVAGTNMVTTSFEIALQVSTLLYPAGKILKNVFILSEGEHPPQWVMERIYNFQKNGDLSEFLSSKKEEKTEETLEELN